MYFKIFHITAHENRVFLQIAAAVAQVHKEADSMRQLYMTIKSGGSGKSPRGVSSSTGNSGSGRVPNPFEDADRKEAAEQRVLEQRIHTEAARYHQQQRQQQPQLGQTGALPGATPAAGLGGFGALSTPAAGGGGFGGGFGSTPGLGGAKLGGGFGSTPAVGATTTPGGFGSLGGFGSTAAATPAAAPAAGGFGAPATPAAGGFGAPATPAVSGFGVPVVAGAFSLPPGSAALNAFPGVPGGSFGAPTAGMGGKSSFAALDLATPLGGSFPSIGGATTPGGPNNPNKKPSKNKK